ncbi:MAG: glycosyltransferase family 4 protein [bacterium]
MHIVIDAHLAVKKIDGVARYLIGLLTELPGLDRSITYSILALPEEKSGLPGEIFAEENVNKVILDLMGPSPRQHAIVPGLLKKLRADLYHHPQYDLPFRVRVPSVVTIHDLKYIFYPQFLSNRSWLKSFYIQHSLRYSLERASRIIAVSENTRRDLAGFLGRPPERVQVIHHGVDRPTSPFVPAAPRLRRTAGQASEHNVKEHKKLALDIQRDFILFVGTRRPHKNIEGLIQALALLRKKYEQEIDLVVAGKAYSDYTAPERLVQHLGLQHHVHFLDFVPDAELAALYQSARVVSLPSFYEGFGFPVLEALAYGKPFVGSNVTSIPEVVGKAGLLVDPNSPEDIADKINQILSDESLAEALCRKALQRVEEFTWKAMAEATLKVYLEASCHPRFG